MHSIRLKGRLGLPALFLVSTAIFPASFSQGTPQSRNHLPHRRALLIGINIYAPMQTTHSTRVESGRISAAPKRTFPNLLGPVNDVSAVREILIGKYGFVESDLKVLENHEAKREAIIKAIQNHLIDEAAPGDICFLYYSGHGSRVRNSKDPKGWDESIVPADSAQGAPDIRDKELARLFLKAIDKGVSLTAVFDSCNSGSIARGYPQPDQRLKALASDERDVADARDFKDTPEDRGMLVLSASKDEQSAIERTHGDKIHGDFTWALASVLKQPSVYINESIGRIFDSVVGIMMSESDSSRPVLGGTVERRKAPLFGGSQGDSEAPTAAVIKVDRGILTLKGGLAMGINKDCELIQAVAREGETPVRLRVTGVKGLDLCEATLIEGQGAIQNINPGTLFLLDRFVAPRQLNLKVYIPTAITEAELVRVKREIEVLNKDGAGRRFRLIDDPTTQTPTCVLEHGSRGWNLVRAGAAVEQMTEWPTAEALSRKLSPSDALFINVPPSMRLRQEIALGKDTKRELIAVSDSAAEAQYVLAGRIKGAEVEYAWVRMGAASDDRLKPGSVLPVRTAWLAAGETVSAIETCARKIEERAVVLGKINGWIEIQAPSSERDFPYKLSLRRVGAGVQIANNQGIEETSCSDLPAPSQSAAPFREGQATQGDCYDLVLATDETALARMRNRNWRVKRQWVYVFSIDSEGSSRLLFPARGVVENQLPLPAFKAADPPRVITLNPSNARVWYEPPFGLDAYILLASDEELTNPDVLEFDGVTGRGQGGDSALANLIDDLRTGTRSGTTRRPAPLNWSIDRVFIRSVGKSK